MQVTKQQFRETLQNVLKRSGGVSGTFFKLFPIAIIELINQYFGAITATTSITSKYDVIARSVVSGEIYALRCYWMTGPSLSIRQYNDPYDNELYGLNNAEDDVPELAVQDINFETRIDTAYIVFMKFLSVIEGNCCFKQNCNHKSNHEHVTQ